MNQSIELEVGRMKTYEVIKSINNFKMFWNSLTLYFRYKYAKIFPFQEDGRYHVMGKTRK